MMNKTWSLITIKLISRYLFPSCAHILIFVFVGESDVNIWILSAINLLVCISTSSQSLLPIFICLKKLKIKKMYLLSGERASFVVISSSVLLAVDCTVCVAVRIQIGERCAVGASSTADRSQQLSVVSNQPGQITVGTVDWVYIFNDIH